MKRGNTLVRHPAENPLTGWLSALYRGGGTREPAAAAPHSIAPAGAPAGQRGGANEIIVAVRDWTVLDPDRPALWSCCNTSRLNNPRCDFHGESGYVY